MQKSAVPSDLGIQSRAYKLCDEWKWLNVDLHIICIARPRYQKVRLVPFVGPAFFLPTIPVVGVRFTPESIHWANIGPKGR